MLLNQKLSSYKTKEYLDNDYFDIYCREHEGINESVCILLKIKKYFPSIIELNKNEYRIQCIEKNSSIDFRIIDNKIITCIKNDFI